MIIVCQLSRMARNRCDDAIVIADLLKRGVTLVSATEAIDDTPVGQLMPGNLYFFCRGRQKGVCQAPHVNVALVEDAVERAVLDGQQKSVRLLRQQITTKLKELDTKEENLIDLAADGTMARPR
ncbi:recombinase family protein [Amycolatopsis rhabdoformis]|uniref:Recombinase family protein n=1 Tax=Amycolatopsis rhabdoformis TaxID=1448059 RepID=A0ABZ1I8G0_9PSEU|nr:recombinase family protein [Amycolatopsis rhabdoformis]WSE29981.1 recombinase family protein [Amycolatopsis rhabdoformis]